MWAEMVDVLISLLPQEQRCSRNGDSVYEVQEEEFYRAKLPTAGDGHGARARFKVQQDFSIQHTYTVHTHIHAGKTYT